MRWRRRGSSLGRHCDGDGSEWLVREREKVQSRRDGVVGEAERVLFNYCLIGTRLDDLISQANQSQGCDQGPGVQQLRNISTMFRSPAYLCS